MRRLLAASLCLLLAGPVVAGTVYHPGQSEYGSVLFEDQWPCRGDFDFNDLVLRYNVRIDTQDGSGAVERLSFSLPMMALGSSTCGPGLGFALPLPAGTPLAATISIGGSPPTPVSADPDEPEMVLWLAEDLRADLCGGAPGFLNTDPLAPTTACEALALDIEFVPPVQMPTDDPPFDLFIHRCGDRSQQIHRPAYGGTVAADPLLFGTCDDASTPPSGPFYIDHDGVPFAITAAQAGFWPVEGASVREAFPEVLSFYQSGGSENPDWYQHPDYDLVYLPEPSSPWLSASGAVGLAALARRRRCGEGP